MEGLIHESHEFSLIVRFVLFYRIRISSTIESGRRAAQISRLAHRAESESGAPKVTVGERNERREAG